MHHVYARNSNLQSTATSNALLLQLYNYTTIRGEQTIQLYKVPLREGDTRMMMLPAVACAAGHDCSVVCLICMPTVVDT